MKVGNRIAIAIAVIVFTLTMMVGCSDGKKAPAGPVIMAVIPSCEGFTLDQYVNRYTGPTGKYSVALVAGIGKVVAGRGSPTEPSPIRYGFEVDQVTPANDAEPGNFIRRIVRDSAGLYDLSLVGSYRATAFESDGVGAIEVAECQILTQSNFDAPNFHIVSSPTATAGPDWTQLWAIDGVITVSAGTYVSVDCGVNNGVINSLTVHSTVTDKDVAYVEGARVAWPTGNYRFDAVVAKNGRTYALTLLVRVTPSQ